MTEATIEQEHLQIHEANPAEVQEKIEVANDIFSEIKTFIRDRREDQELKLDEIKQLESHEEEILLYATQLGTEEGLNIRELRILQLSAVLHDMSKKDTIEHLVESKVISKDDANKITESGVEYVMAAHSRLAARNVRPTLEKISVWDDIFVDDNGKTIDYNHDDIEASIHHVETAILAHDGPAPGFMENNRLFVNKMILGLNLIEMNETEKGSQSDATREDIKMIRKDLLKAKVLQVPSFNKPISGDRITEILLTADMMSLIGEKGVQKVVFDRSRLPFFVKDDKETVAKYAEYGIKLTNQQAARVSAYETGEDILAMFEEGSKTKSRLQRLFDSAYKKEYQYGGNTFVGAEELKDALVKREEYRRKLALDTQEVQTV